MPETPVFLCGCLLHAPLAEVVLGAAITDVGAEPAQLNGWGLQGGDHLPVRHMQSGSAIDGLVLPEPSAAIMTRLAHYASFAGLDWTEGLAVVSDRKVGLRQVCGPMPPELPAGSETRGWSLPLWAARHGALAVETARDAMALIGQVDPESLRARRVMMQVRADSRLRAGTSATPQTVRRHAGADDVAVDQFRRPYANFFAVEEFDLCFRRFDGSMSPRINRAVFISGDAVTVLPYDPLRDRVLLVEQFRAGPFARGDRNPWALEAIAGRIDPGERPEDCARREAIEEAGLVLDRLEFVAGHYPSPAAKTEYLYSYVAVTNLPDGGAGVFGVAGEAEDIRGHLLSFDEVMQLVASGEVENGPLLVSLLWLARTRPRLRDEAGAATPPPTDFRGL